MERNVNILVRIAVVALVGAFLPMTRVDGANARLETAAFGAGCFWGVEAAFRQVKGVTATEVGYMGGTLKNPTYGDVSTHRIGHVEVCQVTYDPARVSYEKLVEILFQIHNPTAFNASGHDLASQYRSVIFFHTPEQEKTAQAVKEQLQASGKYNQPIATAIVPAMEFWPAEEDHQRYAEKHNLPRCQIAP